MKPILVFLALLSIATAVRAQQVVASSGSSSTIPGFTVDWTLGEPVIETFSGSNHVLTQGMHQTKLLVTALSETDFPGLEVKVFPNPTGRFLKIEMVQPGNELYFYELTDITGRKTLSGRMLTNTEEIDMRAYASGIWFLQVFTQTREYMQVFKIVKN